MTASGWPFMTLAAGETAVDILTAQANGLHNVIPAKKATDELGMPFYLMCALLEKESWGKNIYGHDVGGVFSGPGETPVTEANFAEFYRRVVVNGERSNGVGPLQITYRGFFPMMQAEGLRAWVPYDNILFGAHLFWDDYQTSLASGWSHDDAVRRAGTKYNTGQFGFAAYGDRLLELSRKWRALVG